MPPRGRPDPDARRRAEDSEAALAAGGIPLAAAERLEAFRKSGERFFTSDLSVNELVATRDLGFRPLTQVMGTCFYRTGWQSYPWARGGGGLGGMGWGVSGAGETIELEQQTDGWNEARRLAIGRLAEETRRAGGDAVVGVHLRRRHHDWAAGLIEFVVIGTAVRSERYRLETAEPALSQPQRPGPLEARPPRVLAGGPRGGDDRRVRRVRKQPAVPLDRRLLEPAEPGDARLHTRHLRRPRARDGRASASRRARSAPTAWSA